MSVDQDHSPPSAARSSFALPGLDAPEECLSPAFLIVLVFGMTRVMTLLWFQPPYSEFLDYHYSLARCSDHGLYPFLDYWSEYPPLFPWLSVALYRLSLGLSWIGAPLILLYQILCGATMTLLEMVNLFLLYTMARQLSSETFAQRAAWLYAALFLPLFCCASFFDSLPNFFLLLALFYILQKSSYKAAICIALGAATKLIPLILLPLAIKRSQQPLRVLLVFLLVLSACFVPFWLYQPRWLNTFVRVTLQRPGWETPWALFDGQYSFGYLGPPVPEVSSRQELLQSRRQSRFSSDLSYLPRPRPLMRYLYPWVGLLTLAAFLYTYLRVGPQPNSLTCFRLATCHVLLFFLYARGWSPQFLLYLIPLILLSLPQGYVYVLLLSLINFIEMPIWLFVFPQSQGLLTILVVSRTLLLLWIARSVWQAMTTQQTIAQSTIR